MVNVQFRMQKLLQNILAWLARKTLDRTHPAVVAVAGSVGKTSTRRAIAAVLSRSYDVRQSHKNFNNEIGLPLTILGEKRTGGKNPFLWALILTRGLITAYTVKPGKYPKVLVLEMATDHPGDLKYLCSIAKPDVAVVTAVAEEHTEFLGDLKGVADEEGSILDALPSDGVAILNADDPLVIEMRKRAKGDVATFGFSEKAHVRAQNVVVEEAMGTYFTRYEIAVGGRVTPITLSDCIGEGNVMAATAAAAVAFAMGIDDKLIAPGLGAYQPPPGRLRPLAGIKRTFLLDDTYNSSPKAVELALETFMSLPKEGEGRRYAVLADMLELGALTDQTHRRVGAQAAASGIDVLLCIGPKSKALCDEAMKNGMSEDRVFHLHDAVEAGHFLQERIKPGDMVLVKGSRGMRMERTVKDLMAQPERASELLVNKE